MKKIISLLLVTCLLLVAGCSGASTSTPAPTTPANPSTPSSEAPVKKDLVTIECGGAGNTTAVYAGHVALSDAVNRNSDFVRINVQATAGSTAHYKMFEDKDIDMGTGSGWADVKAYAGGTELYPEPMLGFGTAIIISKNFQSIIVRSNSGINSVADLAGKKIGVGSKGSPASEMAIGTLTALGVTNAEYAYLTTGEVADMFKDGQLDCLISTNPVGNANLIDVTSSVDCKFINITEEEMKICMENDLKGKTTPSYLTHDDYPTAIPAGEKIYTITDYSGTNISLDVADDVVYEICKLYWDNIVDVRTAVAGNNGNAEDILMATAVVHPGAAQYYKEVLNIDLPAEKIAKR